MTSADDARRAELEAELAGARIAELRIVPVDGSFDVAHLREIHRRIFQDFPGVGLDDISPGEFRPPVGGSGTWMKQRGLETVPGPFFVAYSKMSDADRERIEKVLNEVSIDRLAQFRTKEFASQMAAIYSELDYLHPFGEGNSRTLRTFTAQIANQAGYEIDWDRFAGTPDARDTLYIARDLAVNRLAKPRIDHPNSLMRIIGSMSRLQGRPELSELLLGIVRPRRALAFERLERDDALKRHPELAPAYLLLEATSKYVLNKSWDLEKTESALKDAKRMLVKRMDAGEVVRHDQNIADQNKSAVRAILRQDAPNLRGPDSKP